MHDAQHFRLSPAEALTLDPQTRLLLEVVPLLAAWHLQASLQRKLPAACCTDL